MTDQDKADVAVQLLKNFTDACMEEVMKVTVDSDACVGCDLCVEICPDVFGVGDDDGIAKVKVDLVPADAEESARHAIDDCPSEAIKVVRRREASE